VAPNKDRSKALAVKSGKSEGLNASACEWDQGRQAETGSWRGEIRGDNSIAAGSCRSVMPSRLSEFCEFKGHEAEVTQLINDNGHHGYRARGTPPDSPLRDLGRRTVPCLFDAIAGRG
jgi:hypothetical protein